MSRSVSLACILFLTLGVACQAPAKVETEPRNQPVIDDFGPIVGDPIRAELTAPPTVPAPIHRKQPAKVIVDLEVQELTKRLADGVDYVFWTFGGTTPGLFIRVRQGDEVEFHLRNNANNKMPHNIDLHAVTGPGGGAASSFTAPGHETQFSFRALNPGLFVYHCATAPVGMHIGNGMYGMILVEPPEGLPPVDREYYVMQGDFYTEGKTHERGLQAFDLQKAVDERPTYVLFNGAEGALTGASALKAKTGETVRLFVGNGGPNLTSSFHIIGEIFDRVYPEGSSRVEENVQTTVIPPGGAAIVELKVQVPGSYTLVDHAIFRAFNKGAIGTLTVEGPERKDIFTGKQADDLIGQTSSLVAATAPAPAPGSGPLTREQQMAAGEARFNGTCIACHQVAGQGVPYVIPPLAHSDFLMADRERAERIVLTGLNGPVTVNGQSYNNVMPPHGYLSDDELANILTYVRNSWGNSDTPVSAAEIRAMRTKVQTSTATN